MIIINFLKRFSFNFKDNHNNYVYDLKSMNVKFNLILFDIKTRFIINDNVFINMLNI